MAQQDQKLKKLSELFSLRPEYDDNQIHFNTFLNWCNTALRIAIQDQRLLLTLQIKNRLRVRASEALVVRKSQRVE